MRHTLDVIADGGIPFRIVYTPGALEPGTTHVVGAVTFFDRRWEHYGADGREIHMFRLGEILDGSNQGIILADGELEVDARNMATIRFWLRNLRDSIRQGALV